MKVHGEASNGKETAEYFAWGAMKARCSNPNNRNYHNYGGRGITVCPEWMTSYPTFLADMGRRPSSEYSLDRIDNDLNYIPANTKWSTKLEQQQNKRTNKLLEFEGETLCQAEWARRFGMYATLLQKRLKAGWTVERALKTPSQKAIPKPQPVQLSNNLSYRISSD